MHVAAGSGFVAACRPLLSSVWDRRGQTYPWLGRHGSVTAWTGSPGPLGYAVLPARLSARDLVPGGGQGTDAH